MDRWVCYSLASKCSPSKSTNIFASFQAFGNLIFVAVVGVLLCYVDAKEKNWNLDLEPSVTNGRFGMNTNLGYNKNNWNAGINHQYQNLPGKDYHKIGGNVGYDNGRFRVSGSGHYDNTGNWGIGASLGFRWKRSLRKVSIFKVLPGAPC